MSNIYNRDNTFVKYLNVLRQSGTVPSFPTDYSTPTYEILFKNGGFSVVVAATALTQGLDNAWYFSYAVPTLATYGTYLIKYKLTMDGADFETTEDFIIAPPPVEGGGPVGPGVGDFAITDEVQSDTMTDLSGVDVFVFLPSDSVNAIAHATSDAMGQFTVYLDVGSYVVLFNKTNFISETHSLTVDGGGGHVFSGD